MALNENQKLRLGQCLARLVPGFDGQVLAYKDHEVIWNDSRPQPTEAEIIAEYNRIVAEESAQETKQNEKGLALARLKAADANSATTIAQLRPIIADLIKALP